MSKGCGIPLAIVGGFVVAPIAIPSVVLLMRTNDVDGNVLLPAGALLLAVGVAAMQTRYDPAVRPYPAESQVRYADWAVIIGVGLAALTVPWHPGAVATYTLASMALIRARGRKHRAWKQPESILARLHEATKAAGAGARWGLPLAGAALGALLATVLPGMVAMMLALAVAIGPNLRGYRAAGALMWSEREVHRTLSGVANGGAWTPERRDWSLIPGTLNMGADGAPANLWLPLPPNLDDEPAQRMAQEIEKRLRRWGEYKVEVDLGARCAIVRPQQLPTFVSYPDPEPTAWHFFPLGVVESGQQIGWDCLEASPHSLVAGPTGSGKSVLQRSILFHALTHPDWRIVGIDLKRVEQSWLQKYRGKVLKIAKTLADAVELLDQLKAEVERRTDEMEVAGVNHFKALPDPPPPILCMIDEMTNLMALEGVKTAEGKATDELHGRARASVAWLARTSRFAGVYLCLATQRPDANLLGGGELKSNVDFRVAAGRMDKTPSGMVLDSDDAALLPKIKGRGMIRMGGDLDVFQGYFAEQSWYDDWLDRQGWPGYLPPESVEPESEDGCDKSPESPDRMEEEFAADVDVAEWLRSVKAGE